MKLEQASAPLDFPSILKTQPFNHQKQAFEFMLGKENFWALLMEMGTGKTLSLVLWSLYMKRVAKKIDALVILCPKPLVGNEMAEYLRHAADPGSYAFYPVNGSSRKKLEAIAAWDKDQQANGLDRLPILVCNYDSLINGDIYSSLHACTGPRTAIVCDESTKIKSHKSIRSQRACLVGARAGYRGIMTGSPVTESPMDAFGQFKFLSPFIFGGSYFAFRARYAVMGGYGGKQVVGFKNMEEFKKKMLANSFRVTKKECLDLPDKVHETLYFQMPDEMAAVYQQMADEYIVEFGESDDEVYQATIALTMYTRLKEITSGYLKQGDRIRRLKSNPKIEMMKEILEESQDQKIIVWCREREEIKIISEKDTKEFGVDRIFEMHGDVKDKHAVLEEFKAFKGRALMAAQVHTMGMGFTITEATLCVYYSNDFSREIRAQSEDRCHRSGQKNVVTYFDLVAKGTIDMYTMTVLAGKKKMASSLTDFKEAVYFGKNGQEGFEESEF